MDDLSRQLLFYDDLPPEKRRAARKALAEALEGEEADLARALRRWHAARRRVGEDFQADLPARRLLVLYALSDENAGASGDVLSEAERQDLESARPQVEQALRAHPALDDVVEQIRHERDDFETVWNEHASPSAPSAPANGSSTTAEDRPPARRTTRPRRAADRPPATAGSTPKRRPVQRWGWRVAAVVALVAFGVVVFSVFERDRHTLTTTNESDTPRLVALADGSTVRLMPGATLAYVDPEAGAALDRQATLQSGRAFFDIVPDREGFIVETPTAQVTVLGTQFGVDTEERLTRVVLAEGRVALASKDAAGQPVTLRPGQSSRVAAGALPSTPAPVESLSEALAWTGLFIFRSTPVDDLARQLAAHYDRTVDVAPPLQSEEVTGTFDRDRPLRETLRTVAAALDARVQETPGGYVLVPGGP